MSDPFVPSVTAIFVLDNDGQRLSAKYFNPIFATNAEKMAFEMRVFKKTRHNNARSESEIITIDNFTVVFRSGTDAHFYVVGDAKEVGREGGTLEKKGKQGGAVRVKSKMDGVYARGTYTQHFRGVPWILSQNELILATVLDAFRDAIAMLLRGQVDRRSLLDNLDLLMLTVDELVDGGIILETDSSAIVARVLMRGVSGGQNVPLADMTISQAFASAKDSFIKSMGNREGNF
ncbi:nonclathrin coat protein zeta2-cop [Nannochloropsis gaditana CCMP526]|uniref:nonclathrin coat protein zeta2-cop n=1 Tax=Nannochloropsis gaditana (strain CCMP526) TaxID=1093141 RepID=UPI00029F512B|nr:nonclathrin coat protein zeta2-cop [Nannochloropsis gaditana CCMP526]EKU21190.1 nonclathrin coat protein zeta2-cop [Nannochloropsis gaditana CCMP526]|eukprot:XP_005855166.1 nonclathrin coat protein zeta2-cop [Nannochloropsis gaditana CCMP526]